MKNKKETQLQTVKRILLSGKTITTYEAFAKHGITRLSAHIFELREQGVNIKGTWVHKFNCSFLKYHL